MMGLKEKLKIGPQQIAEGAQQLQNYMKSVSVSLTKIEEALNHNTLQVGGYLKGLGAELEKIKEKLGIDDDGGEDD